jgi:hypothetical protein
MIKGGIYSKVLVIEVSSVVDSGGLTGQSVEDVERH